MIGRISGTKNINYGDARDLVDQFVGEIRKKLERGEKVVFDNIGNFVNNSEGSIQFEPDRSANYHLDSYGLEPFQCLPLEGYDVRKRIVTHSGKDPVRMASMRKILWRAAVIIPLLSVLVAVPLKTDLFKTRVETTTMNPLVAAEFEHNKKAVDDDVTSNINKIEESVATIPEITSVPEVTVPVVPESDEYLLITGSFKSEGNASYQVNMLKEEGFTPEIISAPNGFYRVCAMRSKNLNSALLKKDSIAKKFPDTWVTRKR